MLSHRVSRQFRNDCVCVSVFIMRAVTITTATRLMAVDFTKSLAYTDACFNHCFASLTIDEQLNALRSLGHLVIKVPAPLQSNNEHLAIFNIPYEAGDYVSQIHVYSGCPGTMKLKFGEISALVTTFQGGNQEYTYNFPELLPLIAIKYTPLQIEITRNDLNAIVCSVHVTCILKTDESVRAKIIQDPHFVVIGANKWLIHHGTMHPVTMWKNNQICHLQSQPNRDETAKKLHLRNT